MSELPKGWTREALEDLVLPRSERVSPADRPNAPYVGLEHVQAHSNEILGTVPASSMASSSASFEVGDVLYSRMRPYLNKVVRPKFAGLASAEFIVLPETEALDSSFLLKRLSSADFVEFACSQYEGDRPRVKFDSLGKFTIALPPRAEQTRIVAKLEELLSDLDAGVAELKAAQKKLGQYRQSLLKAAVEGALTADWRKQQQAPLSPRGRGAGGEGANTPKTDTWFRDRARELRKAQTPAEHDLWQQLRAKRFSGFKFRRQQVIGNYIVDFVCFDQKLVIELDGSQHAEAKERDESRDRWLSEQGFRVLRFWNNEWMAQAESVLETIWSALHKQPPLPNPSPTRGEGLESETGAMLTPLPLRGGGAGGEGDDETGAQLLARILTERRARWEAKQLAKFKEQGKTPPKDWKAKYPEPVQPDTTDLPELPEGWVWATLSQLGWLDRGRSKHRPRNAPHLYGGQYPFVQTGDIRHADTFLSEVEASYSEAGLAQSRLWPAGTMCITIAANIGKTAILSMEACFPDSVVGFLSGSDDVSIRYVEYFMRSVQQKLENEAPATAQKNINLEILEKVVIPVPPTLEQHEIVQVLDDSMGAARQSDCAIEFALKQSAAQRQNILRAAFSGQLVPQDPNDEPASVLLERIRAERAARDAMKKPHGRKVEGSN